MPYKLTTLKDGGVVSVHTREFTYEDGVQIQKRLFNNPYKNCKIPYFILDISKIKKPNHTHEELVESANFYRILLENNPEFLTATVASEDVEFGLARLWKAHLGDVESRAGVFRTREEAKSWVKKKLVVKQNHL